ncbi:MAG: TAXI family TRAP transporter solute-binding subunit [Rhodospirillales bacterium]
MLRSHRIAAAALAAGLATAAPAAGQQVMVIATNPPGSNYYAAAAAIGKLTQEKLGTQVRVQPTGGSNIYLPMVNRGEVEFSFASVQDIEFAYGGTENFAGKPHPDLRLVAAAFPLVLGLAVPADSPARTVADVKGLRVGTGYAAMFVTLYNQDAMLATGGVTTAQMVSVPVPNQPKGVEALGEGRVDVAVTGLTTGLAREAHARLQSRGGIRYLSLPQTPEAVAAMRKVIRRAYLHTYAPDPATPGLGSGTTAMHLTVFMITHAKMDPETVYRIARLLHASKPALAEATPTLQQFDPAFMAEAHAVPYHPGAIRFYQETGQWPARER